MSLPTTNSAIPRFLDCSSRTKRSAAVCGGSRPAIDQPDDSVGVEEPVKRRALLNGTLRHHRSPERLNSFFHAVSSPQLS